MNKKKKNTRIKHRKNQARVKRKLQASILKANPKKTKVPTILKDVELPIVNKDSVKKAAATVVDKAKSAVKKAKK